MIGYLVGSTEEYSKIGLPESFLLLGLHLLRNPQPSNRLEVLSSPASLDWLGSGQRSPIYMCPS